MIFVFFIKINSSLSKYGCLFSFFLLLVSIILWWRDILRETIQGNHTFRVFSLIKVRIVLFISREVIFFFRFFWAFFHFRLAPEFEIGNSWPPLGISIISPYHLPLLNTVILLSSGATVTWAHYSVLKGHYFNSWFSMVLTVMLGVIFTFFQAEEYAWTEFSLNDRVFGSIFFLLTGFHGLHVLIGTVFLTVNLFRIINREINIVHHFRLEAASWYWHFVDVVWIYLYIFVYWLFF